MVIRRWVVRVAFPRHRFVLLSIASYSFSLVLRALPARVARLYVPVQRRLMLCNPEVHSELNLKWKRSGGWTDVTFGFGVIVSAGTVIKTVGSFAGLSDRW
jgi:hypothetical protein